MLMGASLQPWGAAVAGWCGEMQSRPWPSNDAGFVFMLEKYPRSPCAAVKGLDQVQPRHSLPTLLLAAYL